MGRGGDGQDVGDQGLVVAHDGQIRLPLVVGRVVEALLPHLRTHKLCGDLPSPSASAQLGSR